MKRITLVCLAFIFVSIGTVIKAENYKGILTVKVDGKAIVSEERTVVATKCNNATADLQINTFDIMFPGNIKMDIKTKIVCSCFNNDLKLPAVLTLPTTVNVLLGKLDITSLSGKLEENKCSLTMNINASKQMQLIEVTFIGKK